MFTFSQVLEDSINKVARRRTIVVEFVDGQEKVNQSFSFAADTPIETIKKTVKNYLQELNFTPETLTDLTVTESEPTAPTQAEIDRDAWLEDWRNLQAAKKLETNGVSVISAQQMSALQTKVKNGFKPSYVDIV